MATLQEKYNEILNKCVEQGLVFFKRYDSRYMGYVYTLRNEMDRTKAIQELVPKEEYISQYTDYVLFKGLLEGYHATYD